MILKEPPCAGQPPPPPPLYSTISIGPLLASSTVPGFSPQTSAAIESFIAAGGSPETQAALQTAAEGPQAQGAILAPAAEGAPPNFYVNRPAPPPLQQVLNYTQVVALRGEAATTRCSIPVAGTSLVHAGVGLQRRRGVFHCCQGPPIVLWCSACHMTGSTCMEGVLACCGQPRFPGL